MRFLQRESAERGEADMLTSTMSQLPLIDLSSLSNMFYCLVLFFCFLIHCSSASSSTFFFRPLTMCSSSAKPVRARGGAVILGSYTRTPGTYVINDDWCSSHDVSILDARSG